MRSRAEIEAEANDNPYAKRNPLSLEVALDIRELLIKQFPETADKDDYIVKLKTRIEHLEIGLKFIVKLCQKTPVDVGTLDKIDAQANWSLAPHNAYIPAQFVRAEKNKKKKKDLDDPDFA